MIRGPRAMELSVVIAGRTWRVALDRARSLAIPLRFGGLQPNFFDAPEASARPLTVSGFVGDTRQGGSCNVAALSLVPHCNGTHTESAGHILHDPCPVHDALEQSLMPAVVVSVTPAVEGGDRVISRDCISAALSGYAADELAAVVVRTLPNDATKLSAVYGDDFEPPFFAEDAIRHLTVRGVRHLLADIPSIDRMQDGGRLAGHRAFWNVPLGRREAGAEARLDRTITEMIFVPDDIADGLYLLNLQVPAFDSDAAPSRPVLYPLTEAA